MGIEALVFDSDGTIIDITSYLPIFCELQRRVHRKLHAKKIPEEIGELYIPFRLPLKSAEEFMRKEWGVETSAYWSNLAKLDIKEREKAARSGLLRCYEDVKALREIKLPKCPLSNTPHEIIMFQLEEFGISDLFRYVQCSDYKSEMSKPETKGLEMCLKQMQVSADRTLVVGDSDIDVLVGKSAGAKTALVKRAHYNYNSEGADYIITSLWELKEIL